ncbi:hypothetical protein [Pseudochryseolinea flava]|uniref:Uncharacterized protein n=1 Tax=Pseudochryseolinea flava TaxID=2059302 RepID=A0A364XUA3_9BACT|nr:hypothetical protein [Pseudochryseolinea flava]RAV97699.1 hypothetical protein DQQ10_27050 [Pseudochryseolinea flava]
MKILTTIKLWIIAISVSGQDLKSDTTAFQRNLDRFINREFSTLTPDTTLSRLKSKYGVNFNTLGECFLIFTKGNLDERGVASMTVRIREIARRFFDEGTPIYLSVGGSQSAEWTAKQNEKNKRGNLIFVSFGNYCVVEKNDTEFETLFNRKTLELLGIESVE